MEWKAKEAHSWAKWAEGLVTFLKRDLMDMHPEYAQYKRKVPALFPSLTRRLRRDAGVTSTS